MYSTNQALYRRVRKLAPQPHITPFQLHLYCIRNIPKKKKKGIYQGLFLRHLHMADQGYSSSSSSSHQSPLRLHLLFVFLILLMFLGFSWYINYEPVLESVFGNFKLFLIVSPLLLLLVAHFLSNSERSPFYQFIPLPERDSFHRAGGTPWGLGFALVLLCFMISYHSYFKESWFPLLNR